MSKDEKRRALAEAFDRHVEEEGRILEEYRRLSQPLGEGPLGFAVDLILTEEEMHHLLLRTMADWLRKPAAAGQAARRSTGSGGDLRGCT